MPVAFAPRACGADIGGGAARRPRTVASPYRRAGGRARDARSRPPPTGARMHRSGSHPWCSPPRVGLAQRARTLATPGSATLYQATGHVTSVKLRFRRTHAPRQRRPAQRHPGCMWTPPRICSSRPSPPLMPRSSNCASTEHQPASAPLPSSRLRRGGLGPWDRVTSAARPHPGPLPARREREGCHVLARQLAIPLDVSAPSPGSGDSPLQWRLLPQAAGDSSLGSREAWRENWEGAGLGGSQGRGKGFRERGLG
jgi:hypothetical protein